MSYTLIDLKDRIVVSPTFSARCLVISKHPHKISVKEELSSTIPKEALLNGTPPPQLIHGLIGIMHFVKGAYLVVIKEEKYVCSISNSFNTTPQVSNPKASYSNKKCTVSTSNRVYRIRKIGIYALYDTTSSKNIKNELKRDEITRQNRKFYEEDWRYLKMLKYLLKYSNFFYYVKSGNYDLTRSYQNQDFVLNSQNVSTTETKANTRTDKTFIWNYKWIPEEILNQTPAFSSNQDYFVKIIQGSVEAFECPLGGGDNKNLENSHNERVKVILISRRSRKMSGTRYFTRGIDLKGNVSNFIEVDQILFYKNHVFSYTLIRGSIPLIWKTNVNMDYSPPMDLSKIESPESQNGFKLHFAKIIKKGWKRVLCLDLTRDNHSGESKLKEEYKKNIILTNSPAIDYLSFDFFRICGLINFKFKKLSILRDDPKLKSFLETNGYFTAEFDTRSKLISVKTQQRGVLRLNCKESLDRTNIISTFIGKIFIEKYLMEIKQTQASNITLRDYPELFQKYNIACALTGDKISKFYAGSGALKTDRIKTTNHNPRLLIKGFFNDAMKNIIRWYQNNLNDGYKQDSIDLLTKNYQNLNRRRVKSSKMVKNENSKEERPILKRCKSCGEIHEDNEKRIRFFWVYCFLHTLFICFKPEVPERKNEERGTSSFFRRIMIIFWSMLFIIFWKISFQSGKLIVSKPKLRKSF